MRNHHHTLAANSVYEGVEHTFTAIAHPQFLDIRILTNTTESFAQRISDG